MTLSSRNPVVEVVARSSGRISHLFVTDGQQVGERGPLAVIENAAETEDVLRLKKLLIRLEKEPEQLPFYLLQDVWRLGHIQSAYTALATKDPAERDYRAAVGQLLAAVREWEMSYCVEAPVAGRVQLLRQGYPNLYVTAGELFPESYQKSRGNG